MGSRKIKFRTFRNNTGGINCEVTVIVVLFNVFNIDGLSNSGLLKQITDVSGKLRVVVNSTHVCFKVGEINCIKTYKRGKQPPVCLSYDFPKQVTLFAKP